MKKVLIVLLCMQFVATHAMFDWFSGSKSSRTEERGRDGEREKSDRSRGGKPRGLDGEGRRSGGSSRSSDRGVDKVEDREGARSRSRSGGMEFRDKSSIKKTLKLNEESKTALRDFSEDKTAQALRAFKDVFKDLQTTRKEGRVWKSSKDTFMLDVLERVGESGKLTGQDMVDLRQSLESFSDVVEKLGNPDSEMNSKDRQKMVEKLKEIYGKDLGKAMRDLTANVAEAFSQLPLEGSGVHLREIRELNEGLKKLQDLARNGTAFRDATVGRRAANKFSKNAERIKNDMKEKYNSFVKILKRILIAVAAIAVVVVGIVFLHYILIAIKIMLIVGFLGSIGYGCYKAPHVCKAIWKGMKATGKAIGKGISNLARSA